MANAPLTYACVMNAPIEVVWNLMTDFARYEQWNPFVVRASASRPLEVGAELRLTAQMPVGYRTRTRHRITELHPPDERGEASLTYVVVGPLTMLCGGRRRQTLSVQPDGSVRYASEESFCGPLERFAPARQVDLGVRRHAQALKRTAEQHVTEVAA